MVGVRFNPGENAFTFRLADLALKPNDVLGRQRLDRFAAQR